MDNTSRIKVTSADYNGRTFDGSPFRYEDGANVTSANAPNWLLDCLMNQTIQIYMRDHTDYAKWQVTLSPEFGVIIAEPGDTIIFDNGNLSVEKYKP